ncbi:hypothetical protein QC762_0029160 [Podospora pseudocomata]|uniref:Secreted protein n=1 Tax=Podospora pseudocomata TaxID=2093779 RepID=A0ABR0GS44_9PEZI|nr:hypothetical protein QC762_0029160 [Podospora pseudocomata]
MPTDLLIAVGSFHFVMVASSVSVAMNPPPAREDKKFSGPNSNVPIFNGDHPGALPCHTGMPMQLHCSAIASATEQNIGTDRVMGEKG